MAAGGGSGRLRIQNESAGETQVAAVSGGIARQEVGAARQEETGAVGEESNPGRMRCVRGTSKRGSRSQRMSPGMSVKIGEISRRRKKRVDQAEGVWRGVRQTGSNRQRVKTQHE